MAAAEDRAEVVAVAAVEEDGDEALDRVPRFSPFVHRLTLEQRTLSLDTPSIPRQRAVVANHTMAGNRDGDRICGDRAADCAE